MGILTMEGQEDLVSRVITRITRVTIWVISYRGYINIYLPSLPDPPSMLENTCTSSFISSPVAF